MRILVLLTCTATLSLACTTADSNEGGSDSTTTTTGMADGFAPFVLRCDPTAADPCATYGSVPCCSDDPTAIDFADIANSVTPAYAGRGGSGIPAFSADTNALSRWGYCLAETTPTGVALSEAAAQGCRAPCNPTWSVDEIAQVCGVGALCCQTIELEPEDCVLDPDLGDAGCFRPVTGNDIQGLGGTDTTNWATSSHATHQDPGGFNCESFLASLPPSTLTDAGISLSDARLACYRRLTVANQRGSCFGADELTACPLGGPDYVDACEQLNLDNGQSGCG